MYAKVIRILAKGYLPPSLVTPLKLQEILDAVKTPTQIMIVIKRISLPRYEASPFWHRQR